MSQNFVITIGRQIGSGGLETAHKLAAEFGIKMYDKEIIEEAARQSGISAVHFSHRDERRFSLNRFFLGKNDTILNDDKLFKIQSDAMQKIAGEHSCIFVGRCADYVLREHPNILNVFLTADLDFRIARLAAEHSWSETEARKFIERNEKERAEYYNFFTFKKWGDSSSYDLCLSTSKLGGTDQVVEAIKFHMKQLKMI